MNDMEMLAVIARRLNQVREACDENMIAPIALVGQTRDREVVVMSVAQIEDKEFAELLVKVGNAMLAGQMKVIGD